MHPEEASSVLDQLLVRWISPLIDLANSRQAAGSGLLDADIWHTPHKRNVRYASSALHTSWMVEQAAAKQEGRKPAFERALFKGFLNDIVNGGLFQLGFLLTQLSQPYLVGYIVHFVVHGSVRGIIVGVGYAFTLGSVSLLSSVCISMALFNMRRLGIAVRCGVMMEVYKHALLLTASSRASNSQGQTTNLLAVDSEKLFLAFQFLHFMWHGPLMTLLVMLLLMRDVGVYPALAAMSWIVVLLPIQNVVATNIGKIRRRLIAFSDERVKLMNEALLAIRTIKMYAWEEPFEKKILGMRATEIQQLRRYLALSSLLRELLFCAGPVTSMVLFTVLIYALGSPIDVVQIFRVLSFINVLRFPLNLLAQSLKNYNDGRVSNSRITAFLTLETLPVREERCEGRGSIDMKGACFSWTPYQDDSFRLANLTVSAPARQLVAVIGAVGSGKSSFISAVLGEVPLRSGESRVSGSLAYCAQTPWIQNLSLRDNVLFGAALDESTRRRYEEAIDASALRHDLSVMPDGDLTEIGERGINLSGGQKARVAIARALLSSRNADIVLFDDPLSAVDGSTGNRIFFNGVHKLLRDKLVIVSLNSHMHLLQHFDRVIIFEGGAIVADGSYSELLRDKPELLARTSGLDITAGSSSQAGAEVEEVTVRAAELDKPAAAKEAPGKLVRAEKTMTGQVIPLQLYYRYFQTGIDALPMGAFFSQDLSALLAARGGHRVGALCVVGLVAVFFWSQATRVAVDYSLVEWMRAGGSGASVWSATFYIAQAVMLSSLWLRSVFLNSASVASGEKIHRMVLRVVLSAPVTTFFDTHAVGEILNRFSKDLEIIDSSVPEFLLQVLINWSQVLSIIGLCMWASPWFTVLLAPISFLFLHMYSHFSAVARDLKRLESAARSPLFSSLSETLSGLDTIRAYGHTSRFLGCHQLRMERNMRFYYHLWMSMSWVTVRLEVATCVILLSVSLLAVCLRESVSPVALGLALSYGLQLTALFQRCVQVTIDVNNYMTSTERVFEYVQEVRSEESVSRGPSEAQAQDWPGSGCVEFRGVVMQYRDNPPVLRGVSFSMRSGQSVGICGRTGAGKSSILLCLLRIVELSQGSVLIDGRDVATVPLQLLRRQIAVIPQDPVIFSGSIRMNLDPFRERSDADVYGALEQVCMREYVDALPGKVDEELQERGENLSQGQRQLLCIARALLRDVRVLVMDEATSAVDPATDSAIQQMLRTVQGRGTTVLTIAHRLSTILSYDKILLLQDGLVEGFDSPASLTKSSEVFRQMLAESGTQNT